MTAPEKAIGYIRVSTEEQAREGISLAAQRFKLTHYALAMDIELVDIIEDAGESAGDMDRPGLRQALTMLRIGEAKTLIIAKLDRLTRDVADGLELVEKYFGAKSRNKLVSLGESIDTRTAAGRFAFTMQLGIAQYELDVIRERTRDALQHLKKDPTVRLGGEAYGWRRSETRDAAANDRCLIEPVAEDLATIARVQELSAQGLGVRAIAAQLEEEGIRTKKGKTQWQPTQVQRMLTRARRSA